MNKQIDPSTLRSLEDIEHLRLQLENKAAKEENALRREADKITASVKETVNTVNRVQNFFSSLLPKLEYVGIILPILRRIFRRKKTGSGNYVMKRNKKGVLEKVYVEIGKTVWGNMTQVKSGITIDDMLAFPYGNGDKEGVKCEKSDSFEDYGSYEGGLG